MQQSLAKSGHVLADISTRNRLENLQLQDEMDREQRALLVGWSLSSWDTQVYYS